MSTEDPDRCYIVQLDRTKTDRRGGKWREILDLVRYQYGLPRREYNIHLRRGMWTVISRPMFKHTFRSVGAARRALKAVVPTKYVSEGWRASILVLQVTPAKPVSKSRWIEIWPEPNAVEALGALCPVTEVEQG